MKKGDKVFCHTDLRISNQKFLTAGRIYVIFSMNDNTFTITSDSSSMGVFFRTMEDFHTSCYLLKDYRKRKLKRICTLE